MYHFRNTSFHPGPCSGKSAGSICTGDVAPAISSSKDCQ